MAQNHRTTEPLRGSSAGATGEFDLPGCWGCTGAVSAVRRERTCPGQGARGVPLGARSVLPGSAGAIGGTRAHWAPLFPAWTAAVFAAGPRPGAGEFRPAVPGTLQPPRAAAAPAPRSPRRVLPPTVARGKRCPGSRGTPGAARPVPGPGGAEVTRGPVRPGSGGSVALCVPLPRGTRP